MQRVLFDLSDAPIPHKEHKEVYESTGLDLDGRHDHLKTFYEFYIDKRRNFATYCKDLPHFHKFQDVDQVNITNSESYLHSEKRSYFW